MDRRRLLTLYGAGFACLAGCLTGTPTDTGDGSNDPTDDGSDESPTNSPSRDGVVVDDVVVRKAVTYESLMGSGGVLAADRRQYVVASVRADRELSESAFTFETDEESWAPGLPDTAGGTNYAVAGHEGGRIGYHAGSEEAPRYLAFAVPSPLSTSNPRIRFEDDIEWPLPDGARERLAASAPRFELDVLEVPDEISQGERLSVSLTATNVSETDGRFLAAVYWPTNSIADDDESHVVEREVDAGDDLTASLSLGTEYTTEPVTLSVRGHVAAERTVRVRNDSTPS